MSAFQAATADNVGQIISLHGNACPAILAVREPFRNAVEANQAAAEHGLSGDRQVIWSTVNVHGHTKLMCTDTGTGIAPEHLIDRVLAFGATASNEANHGMGMSISQYKMSGAGVTYYTTTDGVTYHTVTFGKADDNVRVDRRTWGALAPVRTMTAHEVATLVPDAITAAGHGTAVVFLGNDVTDDVAENWRQTLTGGRNPHWLTRALNTRFVRLPDAIEAQVDTPGAPTMRVNGREYYLELFTGARLSTRQKRAARRARGRYRHDGDRGTVTVRSGGMTFEVAYFLLDSGKTITEDAPLLGNCVQVVHDDEIYFSSTSLLPAAGVFTGNGRVELHIRAADPSVFVVKPDRSGLEFANGADFTKTIEGVCAEFKTQLPASIREMLARRVGTQQRRSVAEKAARYWDRRIRKFGARRARANGRTGRLTGTTCGGYAPIPDERVRSTSTVKDRKVRPLPPDTAASAARTVSIAVAELDDAGTTAVGQYRRVIADLMPRTPIWDDDPDAELGAHVGRYDVADRRLVINGTHPLITLHLDDMAELFAGEAVKLAAARARVKAVIEDSLCGAILSSQLVGESTHVEITPANLDWVLADVPHISETIDAGLRRLKA